MDESLVVQDVLLEIIIRSEHMWTNFLKICKFSKTQVENLLQKRIKDIQRSFDRATRNKDVIKTAETGNVLLMRYMLEQYQPKLEDDDFTQMAKTAILKDYAIYVKYLLSPRMSRTNFPMACYGSLQDTIYHMARANNNDELAELTMLSYIDPWFTTYGNKWCKSLDKVCTDNQSDLDIRRAAACENRCGACFYWDWGMRGAIMARRLKPLQYMIAIVDGKTNHPHRKYRKTGIQFDWKHAYLLAAEYGNQEIFNLIKQATLDRHILVDRATALTLAKSVNNTYTIPLI